MVALEICSARTRPLTLLQTHHPERPPKRDISWPLSCEVTMTGRLMASRCLLRSRQATLRQRPRQSRMRSSAPAYRTV
jgi:hypothetical protein